MLTGSSCTLPLSAAICSDLNPSESGQAWEEPEAQMSSTARYNNNNNNNTNV